MCRDALRREQKRLKISEWARRVFVWMFRFAQRVGWRDWKNVVWIVTPATFIDWHCRRYTDWWTLVCAFAKPADRPEIPLEIQRTIARLTRKNPLRPPERIQGEEWKHYGVHEHRQSVRKYMPPVVSSSALNSSWINSFRLSFMVRLASINMQCANLFYTNASVCLFRSSFRAVRSFFPLYAAGRS